MADVCRHDLILDGKINLLSPSIHVGVGCLGILRNHCKEMIIVRVKVSWGRTDTGGITPGFRESRNGRDKNVRFEFHGFLFVFQCRQEWGIVIIINNDYLRSRWEYIRILEVCIDHSFVRHL